MMLLALASFSQPAAAADAESFSWDWSRTHRFAIESQVQLPLMMWLATPFNQQARMVGFDLRVVTTCGDAQVETKRTVQVLCTLDDVALSASGLGQEQGLLQPIVEELDDLLTGAAVQLQIHDTGRIVNIDLEGLDRRNNRVGRINETLRLMLSRAFAGLDMALPQGEERAWPQYDSWLLRAPDTSGSAGGSEVVHQRGPQKGSYVNIVSAGRSVIIPGNGLNKFDTRMESQAIFDLRSGRLTDRTWLLVGGPTPSSWIAQGTEGYPYVQRGRLVALTGDETWDVGQSMELQPETQVPSALQQGVQLGTGYPQKR